MAYHERNRDTDSPLYLPNEASERERVKTLEEGVSMGRYLRDAKEDARKIKDYYDLVSATGYQQAEPHFHNLSALLSRASRSKNDKSDAVRIGTLLERAREQMTQLKKREEAWVAANKS